MIWTTTSSSVARDFALYGDSEAGLLDNRPCVACKRFWRDGALAAQHVALRVRLL